MIAHRLPVALFGLLAGLAAQSADFLVDRGRAGAFEVGLPIDSVLAKVGSRNTRLVDLSNEGQFSPAIEIRLPGGPVRSLVGEIREFPCGVFALGRISVYDRRFRTPDGLGIGSTLRDIRRLHSVRWSSEGGSPHVRVEKWQLSFEFGSMSQDDSVVVTSIFIPGDPREVRRKRCP